MSHWVRKAETAANLAIIGVSILIAVVIVRTWFLTPARPQAVKAIPSGTRMSLPDVDWAKRDRTVVIALEANCPYCTESAPFYQRLVRETRGNGRIGVVAVLPQDAAQARSYLQGLGLELAEVRQLPLTSIGVRATPTIALVDSNGVVVQSWLGKLTPDRESEVLSAMTETGGKTHG